MTAYRQQALAVANALTGAPSCPRDLRPLAPDAAKILQGNVYGWFEPIERGLYGLTSSGRFALVKWSPMVPSRTTLFSAPAPPAKIRLAMAGECGLGFAEIEPPAPIFTLKDDHLAIMDRLNVRARNGRQQGEGGSAVGHRSPEPGEAKPVFSSLRGLPF